LMIILIVEILCLTIALFWAISGDQPAIEVEAAPFDNRA
jgi:hypothetical protein